MGSCNRFLEKILCIQNTVKNSNMKQSFMYFIKNILPLVFLFSLMFYTGIVTSTIAADPASNIVEQIHDKFHQKSDEYGTKLKGYALSMFKLFLLVGIAVFGLQAALGRAEIADVIKEFLIMMTFAAFCYIAIQYYQEWTGYI